MKDRYRYLILCLAAGMAALSRDARAQVTPAAGYTPPDDTPSVAVGGTVYANFEYLQEPTVRDAANDVIHQEGFNITRAYITVTGQINRFIGFRITPDVVRVGQVNGANVAGLTGTLTYRLKYAFGQFNFSGFGMQKPWVAQGDWIRLGLQQTPIVDYEEQIYRYRYQGTIFIEREGFLTSSDLGGSVHWNFPDNYGDIHVGYYNGEGYTSPQVNNQFAFQIRGTVRPVPGMAILKGLRLTGFYDSDHYIQGAKKERTVAQMTFENPYVNVGFDYLWTQDQTTAILPVIKAKGYSVWATPRTTFGLEALIRYDDFDPNENTPAKKKRLIVGPAYWFKVAKSGLAASVLLGYEEVKYSGYTPASPPREERYGVYTLFNF
jgi:hypothetical protein